MAICAMGLIWLAETLEEIELKPLCSIRFYFILIAIIAFLWDVLMRPDPFLIFLGGAEYETNCECTLNF